jgi:hypothetical protein
MMPMASLHRNRVAAGQELIVLLGASISAPLYRLADTSPGNGFAGPGPDRAAGQT